MELDQALDRCWIRAGLTAGRRKKKLNINSKSINESKACAGKNTLSCFSLLIAVTMHTFR